MKRFIGVVFCLLLSGGLFAQTDTRPAAEVRLIRTKAEVITVAQLKTAVETQEKTLGYSLTQEQRRQLLDTMIDEKLILQAAERDRVTISELELEQGIQVLKNQLTSQLGRAPTDAEFASTVRSQLGMEMPAFRVQLRQRLLLEKYITSKKETLLRTFKEPTETEIATAYAVNKAQFIRPDTVRFSLIMVPITSAAEKPKAKELADRLIRDIGSNASKFDEAVMRGQSTSSAGYRAGDGGYLPLNSQARQMLGADFINTAFSLKQGEVSKLIESASGYYIIKITEMYSQKFLTLDDILQLGSRVTVRQYISVNLAQEKQQALFDKAVQELTAELRAGSPFQIYENNIVW
jgi:parvulin-like peptidyl-prolyl isomerase